MYRQADRGVQTGRQRCTDRQTEMYRQKAERERCADKRLRERETCRQKAERERDVQTKGRDVQVTDLTTGRHVVEQSAGSSIGSVHRAQKACSTQR